MYDRGKNKTVRIRVLWTELDIRCTYTVIWKDEILGTGI
jgi:hypothetical protein